MPLTMREWNQIQQAIRCMAYGSTIGTQPQLSRDAVLAVIETFVEDEPEGSTRDR